jgi:hypothetical protein
MTTINVPKGLTTLLAIACLLAAAGVSFGPQYMRDGFNNAPAAFEPFKRSWFLNETPEVIYRRHHGAK